MRKRILIAFATLGVCWAPSEADSPAPPTTEQVPTTALVPPAEDSIVTMIRNGTVKPQVSEIDYFHEGKKFSLVFMMMNPDAKRIRYEYETQDHDGEMLPRKLASTTEFKAVFPQNSFYSHEITFTMRKLEEHEDFDHILAQITRFASTMRREMMIEEDVPGRRPQWFGFNYVPQKMDDILKKLVKDVPCITHFRCANTSRKFPSS